MTRFAAVSLLLALAGCSPASTSSASLPGHSRGCLLVPSGFGPAGEARFRVETVVTGLEVPWGLAFLPGGDWLITERPGRLRLFSQGSLAPEPVLTLDVAPTGEGGLLGIALSPAFDADRLFYVYATFFDGDYESRVLRYQLSEDHRTATLDRVILDHIPGAEFHDGGRIHFGPDGMLYVTTGDARNPPSAPSLGSIAGKLLRLTPEGGIPADNPHGAHSPIFLSGLRNSQGFDWITPRFLAVVDHGPSGDLGLTGRDEVNVAVGGLDLGWPRITACEAAEGRLSPSLAWTEALAPGGAAIYTSANIPEWTGSLMIGSLVGKHLHRVAFNPVDPRKVLAHEVYLLGEPPAGHGRLREVVMGPGADLYVTTSNCDGRGECPADGDRILRIRR